MVLGGRKLASLLNGTIRCPYEQRGGKCQKESIKVAHENRFSHKSQMAFRYRYQTGSALSKVNFAARHNNRCLAAYLGRQT